MTDVQLEDTLTLDELADLLEECGSLWIGRCRECGAVVLFTKEFTVCLCGTVVHLNQYHSVEAAMQVFVVQEKRWTGITPRSQLLS